MEPILASAPVVLFALPDVGISRSARLDTPSHTRFGPFSIDVRERVLTRDGELVALTFTSPSTVDNFLACLDDSSLAAARRCMIAAIGSTTAKRLAEVGLPADVVPVRPDVVTMVAALAQAYAQVELRSLA